MPGGQKRSCGGVFATFVCKPILKQYIIRLLQYIRMEIFQEASMVLFTICVMTILNLKQFPGLSVGYLQNSTQILNMMQISAILGHGCF